LNITATRVVCGTISLSSWSHLPPISGSKLLKPVIFPPGCARLGTRPWPTGSEIMAKTIGIVEVARCRGPTTGDPTQTITAGFEAAISSAAAVVSAETKPHASL